MNFSLSGGDQNTNQDKPKAGKDKEVEKYKKDWFDWWLNDDPPAPSAKEELRANRVKQANAYTPRGAKTKPSADSDTTKPAPTNVTININLSKLKVPKIKKPKVKVKPPKIKLPALPYKLIVIVGVALVAISVPTNIIYKNHQKQVKTARLETARQTLANTPARTSPSFTPAVPKDKPDLANVTDNSKKVAYDGNRDTLSYIDNLGANNITLSQQPLPSGSGTAQQTVAKVSNQINAKTPILLSGSNVAYLHEEKGGAQTVVFSIKDLLIFINSPFHHDSAAYKTYIENLQ